MSIFLVLVVFLSILEAQPPSSHDPSISCYRLATLETSKKSPFERAQRLLGRAKELEFEVRDNHLGREALFKALRGIREETEAILRDNGKHDLDKIDKLEIVEVLAQVEKLQRTSGEDLLLCVEFPPESPGESARGLRSFSIPKPLGIDPDGFPVAVLSVLLERLHALDHYRLHGIFGHEKIEAIVDGFENLSHDPTLTGLPPTGPKNVLEMWEGFLRDLSNLKASLGGKSGNP